MIFEIVIQNTVAFMMFQIYNDFCDSYPKYNDFFKQKKFKITNEFEISLFPYISIYHIDT